MNRKTLTKIAEETEAICQRGSYVSPSGKSVFIGDDLADSVSRTRLFTPAAFKRNVITRPGPTPIIEVTVESTLSAARRYAAPSPDASVYEKSSRQSTMVLNFASARNVGGGWLNGSNAQEESLARSSGLVPTLESQPGYYDANRIERSTLYTDHVIFSGLVPFFRDDDGTLLEEPYRCSVITCPAPNRSALRREDEHLVEETLNRRARNIVALASNLGCETLILGAWGCGVFHNDPAEVATAFKLALDEFAVKRAVFAILGPDGVNHDIFREILVRPIKPPTTLEELVEHMLATEAPDAFTSFAAEKREDIILYHHTLGRHIRNKYKLWAAENEALLRACCQGRPLHADEASTAAMERLWERLQKGS